MKNKKIIVGLLSLSMLVSASPAAVMAETNDDVSTTSVTSSEDTSSKTVRTAGTLNNVQPFAEDTYVLMNIPYDEFYKADVNNNVPVDAFTSATKAKVRTGTLAGGSYHEDSTGEEITGVLFPVKVPKGTDFSKYTQVTDDSSVEITVTNRGQSKTTVYNGQDALFESPTYSYYILSETPDYYKELTIDQSKLSFGSIVGESTEISDVATEFSTESNYGDYQLDLDSEVIEKYFDHDTDKIYGVIVSTDEGNDYGMRHLENLWLGSELAWSTGFTSAVHNCPTSSDHYKGMMGQTINKITYYTSKGIFEIPVNDIYVPIKFAYYLNVTDANVNGQGTNVTLTKLPKDYVAQYSVDGLTGVSVKNGKLTYTNEKPAIGTYTLNIKDQSGKYADISTDFLITTNDIPVKYENKTLKPADGFEAIDVNNYVSAITNVSVNGVDYSTSDRNAITIINSDGTIKTDAAPFASGSSFNIKVTATGYNNNLNFTYVKDIQEITTSKTSYSLKYGKTLSLAAKSSGKVSYKVTSGSSIVSVSSTGIVTPKKVGTAKITITAGETLTQSAGTKVITVTVSRGTQTINAKVTSKTYKVSTLKKSKKTFKIGATTTKNGGKLTYSITGKSKSYLSVSKGGTVTVKKNAKKGTYKITVKAAKTTKYNAASKTITVKIK